MNRDDMDFTGLGKDLDRKKAKTIDDGHTFICDPPPGGKYILTVPGKLTSDQVERLKAAWEEAMKNPKTQLIVLEEGMKISWIPACPTWPDAEYCGA